MIQVPQWCKAQWRWQGAVSKSLVNSADVVSAADAPRSTIEIICNQVNFLRNHDSTNSEDELLGNAFLLGVDVAYMKRRRRRRRITISRQTRSGQNTSCRSTHPQATVGQAQTSTFKLKTATQDGKSSVTAGHPLKRDRVWGSVTINFACTCKQNIPYDSQSKTTKKKNGIGVSQGTPPCTHKTERHWGIPRGPDVQQTYHKPTALGSPEGPRREQHDLNCKNCRDQCRGIHKLSLKLGWFT